MSSSLEKHFCFEDGTRGEKEESLTFLGRKLLCLLVPILAPAVSARKHKYTSTNCAQPPHRILGG